MWLRSSTGFYSSFNLAMDRSHSFGSMLFDFAPFLDSLSLRLRTFSYLTSPDCITRRTVLQKVRDPPLGVSQLVNIGFQDLFHSPPGVLLTFPSQYLSLSVTKEYLALRSGLRSFPRRFLVSRGTLDTTSVTRISSTGLSPSLVDFSKSLLLYL